MEVLPVTSLTALLHRITGGNLDHVLTTSPPNAWLDTFLMEWVTEEEKFFGIALENEEIDMYNRALSLHLIGEDEVTPIGFTLNGYQRPSTVRRLAVTGQARAAAEKQELATLKESRRDLRQCLARTTRSLNSVTSKVADIKQLVNERDRKLVDLGLTCDSLIAKSVNATSHEVDLLSAEFASSFQSSNLLQMISISLQDKYRFIKNLPSDTTEQGFAPQEFRKECWLLSRAFSRLEDKMFREELLKILDNLQQDGPPAPPESSTDGQIPPSASAIVTGQLQDAWTREKCKKLLHREKVLEMSSEILREQILPPLILLYTGLTNIQSHVSNIHAQCVVLLSELERLASSLNETEQHPLLTEDDDLLIRLSTLLRLDPEDQGELSAEAVLDQLSKLKNKGERGLGLSLAER